MLFYRRAHLSLQIEGLRTQLEAYQQASGAVAARNLASYKELEEEAKEQQMGALRLEMSKATEQFQSNVEAMEKHLIEDLGKITSRIASIEQLNHDLDAAVKKLSLGELAAFSEPSWFCVFLRVG